MARRTREILPHDSQGDSTSHAQAASGLVSSSAIDAHSIAPLLTGEGNPAAELIFVGERTDGPAAELLGKMVEAMGLQREQVYFVSLAQRDPGILAAAQAPVTAAQDHAVSAQDLILACHQQLVSHFEAFQPKVVVALGETAAQALLLQPGAPITSLRGRFRDWRGARLMPTFHPAHLLTSPASKRDAWADLQQVAQALGISPPAVRGRTPSSTHKG